MCGIVIVRLNAKEVSQMHEQEDLRALELFNTKAERLNNSSFLEFLRQQGLGVTISWGKDKPSSADIRWPDEEAIDAFVLTFRFFIQSNEKSSFENVEKTYDNLPISRQKKELFKNARKKLNDYLDLRIPWQVNNQQPTRREILNVFIYGEFAHANEIKRVILDQWMSRPIFDLIVYTEFLSILWNAASFIAYVRELNEGVIKELGEKK